MVLDYSAFWFYLLLVVGAIFISLAILFGLQIVYSAPIPDTYKECIASDLPPHICDMIFPPLKQQNI